MAKTLLVKTLAAALDLDFERVQFTPDLMPSDVTGQSILDQTDGGDFRFREGPVFTNLLLADEINRTPPKTQAALLEAMEERQVTVEGAARPLPDPFVVVATQNPVEYEGTYPLPEAQLDRFLFKLLVGYPSFEQETAVLARHHRGLDPHDVVAAGVRPVAGVADLDRARLEVDAVAVRADRDAVHRGAVPGHAGDAVGAARRVAPRRRRAAARGQGVGVAVGPRLRHPRRGQGGGQADAAPPAADPSRARARGRDRRRRARLDPGHRAGPALRAIPMALTRRTRARCALVLAVALFAYPGDVDRRDVGDASLILNGALLAVAFVDAVARGRGRRRSTIRARSTRRWSCWAGR